MLWSRNEDVAAEINASQTNSTYLPGFSLPAGLRATGDLAASVAAAEVLVVAVPSHAFRATLQNAQPFLRPWIPVISLTKGLEEGSRLRMTEIIKEVLPGHPAAALTGPNLAREIMAGRAAASVIATEDLSVATALQRVLNRGLFRVYTNHDVIGCEIGGALKNVIAIATGMAEGLGVGDNTRAAVITRGLAELTRLGVALGGEPATFAGLTGLGDLVVTCVSPQSRNRSLGEELGRGRLLKEILAGSPMVAEGVRTSVTAVQLAAELGVDTPICREVARVVQGEITGSEAYRGLRVTPGHEQDPD
jgi:glycerol-3-phosphate dehydrogenase (NAD(P)+)